MSNHTSKTKQDKLSLSHPSLNICTIIETKFNIENSDNIVTGSLESKKILQSCSDSDPKAAAKKSISYESCLGGCEFSNINELNNIYDNNASLYGVGYVKQYDNIFQNGSYNTNAALLQLTPSKAHSLICNSGSHSAFKSNFKLSPSIIKSTNQVSRLAATLLVASINQPKDFDSDNDSLTRQESPNKHILTQNQVLLIDYFQPSGEKRGNDEKDFSGANKDDTSSSILQPRILQPRIFKSDNPLVDAAVDLVEQKSNLQNLNINNPNTTDESTNSKEDLPKHTILQHQRI